MAAEEAVFAASGRTGSAHGHLAMTENGAKGPAAQMLWKIEWAVDIRLNAPIRLEQHDR